MKKVIKKILLIILITIIVYNIAYIILSFFKINSFFGMRFFIPETNSMKPAIEQRDVMFLKKVKEEKLKQNDVIIYKNGENIRIGRIVKVDDNMGIRSYVVKGDNRRNNETESLLMKNVQGKMIKKFTNGAMFLKILRSKILTVVIFIGLFIRYRLQEYKKQLIKKRKKQNEKMKKYIK